MLKVKILGKPYAGKLHVRIDEGERRRGLKMWRETLYRLFFFLYYTVHFSVKHCDTASYFTELLKGMHTKLHRGITLAVDFISSCFPDS